MPATVIFKLQEDSLAFDKARIFDEMREIFFESSARSDFLSEQDKNDFYQKYLGHYLNHYEDLVWVALNDEKKCLGYLTGARSTDEFIPLQPHLGVFHDKFAAYPAHLHVNCHKDYRGLGIGKLLLEHFENELKKEMISGYHIVTSKGAINRRFYTKSGFEFETQAENLLFMGKEL